MFSKRCVLNLSGTLFTCLPETTYCTRNGTPSLAKKNRRHELPRTVIMPNDDQRRYGFYTCPRCHRGWESSYAWCFKGTNNPSSGQQCQTCKIMVKPHKVERLKCSICGMSGSLCDCDRGERHVDINKPHRSDLCERCKRGQRCNFTARGY
ncbi:zygote arrest protein 1-like [Asterias rubens]|uniref:zygote arrest protein 1-like n=1 Tax=Asterias rubens TaxID=7604 RepID=UPI001455712B|nr:zygote arrest protein 1-like [Asterias rubens]